MAQRIYNCMARSAIVSVATGVAVAIVSTLSFAETVNPGDFVKPSVCPQYFSVNSGTGLCDPDLKLISALGEKECVGEYIEYASKIPGAAKSCSAKAALPNPQCRELDAYSSKLSGSGSSAICQYERTTLPTSYLGDYVGDCVAVMAPVAGVDLVPGGEYFVANQNSVQKDNPELALVQGREWWPFLRFFQKFVPVIGCSPEKTTKPVVKVSASRLAESGAIRRGFAYGFLTMPYKYYPSTHESSAGLPLGGYLGWRVGQPGAGGTFAAAMTVSSVKADVIDPTTAKAEKPTITGSTDAMALSGAIGFVFDVAKSPGGRAFKSGIFVGKDYVNADPSIIYKYNKKTWVAIQFGFDFTDN